MIQPSNPKRPAGVEIVIRNLEKKIMPQDELFPLMTHFKKRLLDQRSKYTYRISPRKVRAWMMSMFDKSFATLQDKLWNDFDRCGQELGRCQSGEKCPF